MPETRRSTPTATWATRDDCAARTGRLPRGGNFESVDSATFCIFLTLILQEIIDTYFLFLTFHLTNTFGFLVVTHVCAEIC